MNLIVRPATPEDAGELGRICYEAFCAIADQHRYPHDFLGPEAAVGLTSYLTGHPGFYGVVAERDERIVGGQTIRADPSPPGMAATWPCSGSGPVVHGLHTAFERSVT